MSPEIGFFSLIIAFFIGTLLSCLPFIQNKLSLGDIVCFARQLERAQLSAVLLSFLLLGWAFFSDDFSVLYVYEHSNTLLPWYYKLTALWGGHEGSLLLWILLLCFWIVIAQNKMIHLPQTLRLWMSATLGAISTGFLGFILFTSSPFQRLLPFPPKNGIDLNPMLQDPGLIIHPPILYMGYVGFAVGFAFAIAVLITGQYKNSWVIYLRPLVSLAWCFLTAGITLGSWWAYYELGWGGWWFWDPVENASLMPWLIGAALIHILSAVEKQNLFKRWSLILLLTGFILSLLGTFLVRSGVLTSVHAFANDPKRGVYILIYLSFVTLVAMILYLTRSKYMSKEVSFSFRSRESLLFINNILLVVICLTVILGTLYPIIIDWLDLGFISVGPPYFNSVIKPIGLILLIVMLAAPASRWLKIRIEDYKSILLEFVVLFLFLLFFWLDAIFINQTFIFNLSLLLAIVLIIEHVRCFIKSYLLEKRLNQLGMFLAHIGFVMTVLGVIIVSNFSIEKDINLKLGQSVTLADYNIKFARIFSLNGPNYKAAQGKFIVKSNNGRQESILYPERRIYEVSKMPMSKTAIDVGLFRDIYIALSNPIAENQWVVRIYYKPFVRWIWLGGIVMFLGGIFSIGQRYYVKIKKDRFLIKHERQTV